MNVNSPLSFGQWLKQRRRALDLTQEELARRIHCSLETIRKIEADTRRPSKEMALLLARELVPAGSRDDFLSFARTANSNFANPPIAAPFPPRAPSHLPLFPDQLIGREAEIKSVRERLLDDDVRLVMLLGPPGVGKTRLALELASTLADVFPDGIYFVDLAIVTQASRVPNAIAQILGVRETAAEGMQERVCTYLREKHALLVLDNLEQVTDAADFIAQMMAGAARLKLVGTSRIPLLIRGEWQFPVAPLAVPSIDAATDVAGLDAYPSISLFVERARAAQPDFRLTPANARAIASLCARVDGLPLAIELIAARSRFLSPPALLERLDAPFLLDTDGMRDLPARQRTLRNAIRWSYDLLDEAEQRLLSQLAVFVGGANETAIAAICKPARESSKIDKHKSRVGEFRVQVLLQSLIDKSLVRRVPDAEPTRVVLLETIREFARERLVQDRREMQTIFQAHAELFLAMAQTAEPQVRGGSDQAVWLNRMRQEHENLRAALHWFRESQQWVNALRLGGAIWHFWQLCGFWSEGRKELSELMAQVLAKHPDFWTEGIEREPELARALGNAMTGAGTLATRQNDYEQGRSLLEQSVALWRRLIRAEDKGEGGRETRRGLTLALGELGFNLQRQENFDSARTLYLESWALSKAPEDPWGLGFASANLGRVAIQQGELSRARKWFEQALAIWRKQGNEDGIAGMMNNLGEVARGQGDLEQARAYYLECLARSRQLATTSRIATVLNNLGQVARRQGERARATELLRESLAMCLELGNRSGILACLVPLGGLCIDRGAFADGVRLFGAVDAIRSATGVRMEHVDRIEYERDVQAANAALDQLTFDMAWAEGRVWTLVAAIEFAQRDW